MKHCHERREATCSRVANVLEGLTFLVVEVAFVILAVGVAAVLEGLTFLAVEVTSVLDSVTLLGVRRLVGACVGAWGRGRGLVCGRVQVQR